MGRLCSVCGQSGQPLYIPCGEIMLSEEQQVLRITVAHVTAVLLPIVGPLCMLLSARDDKLVRRHASAALLLSIVWTLVAIALMSADAGHLTTDESELSGLGTGVLAAAFIAAVALSVVNIRRGKARQMPIGLTRS